MTPEDMAALLARAFAGTSRGWSADEITALLDSSHVFAVCKPNAIALGRVAADEAEILTIATDPSVQRQGAARRLLARFERQAADRGATRVFLEVAANNLAALTLYQSAGYAQIAHRAGYYNMQELGGIDALIMEKPLI